MEHGTQCCGHGNTETNGDPAPPLHMTAQCSSMCDDCTRQCVRPYAHDVNSPRHWCSVHAPSGQ